MNENLMQMYLSFNCEELWNRYLKPILFLQDNGFKYDIEFLGTEVHTGVGGKRADMVFKIKCFYPTIVVIELKQSANTNAIVQVSNYIRQFQETKILEDDINDLKNYTVQCFNYYRYVGIVAGKRITKKAKELVECDLSNSLSYIDFYNKTFKSLPTDTIYRNNVKDDFENKMFFEWEEQNAN